MNSNERKYKAADFWKSMIANEKLKKDFIDNPVSVLVKEGILTVDEAKIPGVDDCYRTMVKRIEEAHPGTRTSSSGTLVLGGIFCWPCKIAMGITVASAVAVATVASGGFDIPALAVACGVSEETATVAVAGCGGGAAELISLLLTAMCGDC